MADCSGARHHCYNRLHQAADEHGQADSLGDIDTPPAYHRIDPVLPDGQGQIDT